MFWRTSFSNFNFFRDLPRKKNGSVQTEISTLFIQKICAQIKTKENIDRQWKQQCDIEHIKQFRIIRNKIKMWNTRKIYYKEKGCPIYTTKSKTKTFWISKAVTRDISKEEIVFATPIGEQNMTSDSNDDEDVNEESFGAVKRVFFLDR